MATTNSCTQMQGDGCLSAGVLPQVMKRWLHRLTPSARKPWVQTDTGHMQADHPTMRCLSRRLSTIRGSQPPEQQECGRWHATEWSEEEAPHSQPLLWFIPHDPMSDGNHRSRETSTTPMGEGLGNVMEPSPMRPSLAGRAAPG